MNDTEAKNRIEQRIRASPRSIHTANAFLLCAALLIFIHRIYYAFSHDIAIWKGLLAGLVLSILCFQSGFMLYQKKKWVYWAVLVVSIAAGLFSAVHGVAEILRFLQDQSDQYLAFLFSVLFALFASGITWSLLRKESRDHFVHTNNAFEGDSNK